ncbi:MAG: beta-N-acetylhexosaminidase [bacterium]
MDVKLPFFNPYDTSDATLRQAAGQLLCVGFQGTDALPDALRNALAAGRVGGAILFRRNVEEPAQVASLTAQIHAAAGAAIAAPFVAVDQEGGRVARLREPLTLIPPMRKLGNRNDAKLTTDISEMMATEISALGFNLNFAPVLDVDTNPDNPVIGDRAFSDDPNVVARMGGAFFIGHMTAGVIPCGKHFPGHGDTDTDSHLELPVLHHDGARFEEVELVPFRKLIEHDVPMLMTAHVLVPALDTVHPATLSHAVMTRLLRDELGYDGVVVTDDLEMKAVADQYEVEEMIELGLRAGVDLFLICHTQDKWERAFEHLVRLGANAHDRARILESANRIMRLKESYLASWPRPWEPGDFEATIGCAEHQRLVDRIGTTQTGVDPTERFH